MSVFASRILARSAEEGGPERPNTSLANDARWSMARMKSGSSDVGNHESFGALTVGPPGSRNRPGCAVPPARWGETTSFRSSLLPPAIEQLHLRTRPGPIARHRPVVQLGRDRRRVADDVLVPPEVERLAHGLTITLPEEWPYIGCEGHGPVWRARLGLWGTHRSGPNFRLKTTWQHCQNAVFRACTVLASERTTGRDQIARP